MSYSFLCFVGGGRNSKCYSRCIFWIRQASFGSMHYGDSISSWSNYTPPKFNIVSEKLPFQKESSHRTSNHHLFSQDAKLRCKGKNDLDSIPPVVIGSPSCSKGKKWAKMTVEASHPKGRSGSVWGCVKMLTLHIDKSSKTTVSNEHHFIGRKPRLVKYNHLARIMYNL